MNDYNHPSTCDKNGIPARPFLRTASQLHAHIRIRRFAKPFVIMLGIMHLPPALWPINWLFTVEVRA